LGKNGIYVILDLHAAGQNRLAHNREYGCILWSDQELQNRVVSLWRVIAERYKNNPYVAGYDIINEPEAPTRAALYSFYQQTIERIREVDNKHILFVELNLYDREKIQFGGEYNDTNIALSIHFYKPGTFTNQGRRGGPPIGQRYPGEYGGIYWDKHQIDKFFADFLAHDNPKRRPLYVGEFGVLTRAAGEDAFQWTEDVIHVLNNKNIHYTYFKYKHAERPGGGYYLPVQDVDRQIKKMRNIIKKGMIDLKCLSEAHKKLFLTENFEAPQKLGLVLKRGFESKR